MQNPNSEDFKFFDPELPENANLLEYFKEKKVLYWEPTNTFRGSIRKFFSRLGVQSRNLLELADLEEGAELISREKPHFIVACDAFGRREGTELLEQHLKLYPGRLESGFFLVSATGSVDSYHQSLSREIDAFLGTPFTLFELEKTFLNGLLKKLHPSKPEQLIFQAKKLFYEDKAEQSLQVFEKLSQSEAIQNSIPFYFLGKQMRKEERFDEAIAYLEKGLEREEFHFGCLKELERLYKIKGLFQKAYETKYKMRDHYGFNPKNIDDYAKLAVLNEKYEDFEYLSDELEKIEVENRSDLAVNSIAAGLYMLGKKFFEEDPEESKTRALNIFKKGISLSRNNSKIVEKISELLASSGFIDEAEEALETSPQMKQSPRYDFIRLEILNNQDSPAEAINLGNQMIASGKVSERVFEIVLEKSVAVQRKPESIELIMGDAISQFPQHEPKFRKLAGR
jgi:tetratricopeptide (TPR) repeat protein